MSQLNDFNAACLYVKASLEVKQSHSHHTSTVIEVHIS